MRTVFLLAVLLIPACARVSKPPAADFGGAIKVDTVWPEGRTSEYIRGIFRVDGLNEHFTLYLMDRNSAPAGRVKVEGRKVVEYDVVFGSDLKQMFGYWPYLFYSGPKKELGAGQNSLRYIETRMTEYGELPVIIDIMTGENRYRIDLEYGDKSAGKD